MKTTDLITQEPFSAIFPIQEKVLDAIITTMVKSGFDPAYPIIVWKDKNIVIDGHTRLAAAIECAIDDVPVIEHNFPSEDVAVRYAIDCQRNRRNLTDADILRLVSELDKRRKQGARTDLAPHGAKSGKSADDTAEAIGISTRKVERTRAVLDKASPEIKKQVEAGAVSINKAYEATREKPEPADEPEPKVTGPSATPPRKKTLTQEIEHYIRESPKYSMELAWRAAKKSEREAFLSWVDHERIKDLPVKDPVRLMKLTAALRRELKKATRGALCTVAYELGLTVPEEGKQ